MSKDILCINCKLTWSYLLGGYFIVVKKYLNRFQDKNMQKLNSIDLQICIYYTKNKGYILVVLQLATFVCSMAAVRCERMPQNKLVSVGNGNGNGKNCSAYE